MPEPKTLIAKRLKDAMDSRGLNTSELARLADVKTTFLYDVLSGKSAHPSSVTLSKVAEVFNLPVSYFTGTSQATPAPQSVRGTTPYITIPPLHPREAIDDVSFKRSWLVSRFGHALEDLRIAKVRGDAMSPTLNEGDIVIINTGDVVPSLSGIFFVGAGKQASPKRLDMLKKSVRVLCDNANYAPYTTSMDELDIVGRIVWVARSL